MSEITSAFRCERVLRQLFMEIFQHMQRTEGHCPQQFIPPCLVGLHSYESLVQTRFCLLRNLSASHCISNLLCPEPDVLHLADQEMQSRTRGCEVYTGVELRDYTAFVNRRSVLISVAPCAAVSCARLFSCQVSGGNACDVY